jgi:phosphatidylserine/phosphatidylglycerophosphate/cardiolipin synthase-like enzyme
MNFTKAGNSTNDENTIILWDVPDFAKQLNQDFMTMWDSIPDEYLTKSPKPESQESINSCFDGMDNDFDEKIDKEDEDCL